jgi:hypothetical protein
MHLASIQDFEQMQTPARIPGHEPLAIEDG